MQTFLRALLRLLALPAFILLAAGLGLLCITLAGLDAFGPTAYVTQDGVFVKAGP